MGRLPQMGWPRHWQETGLNIRSMALERRCGDCKWWEHYDNGRVHARVGLCRESPPSAVEWRNPHPDDERRNRGRPLWPILTENEWCGRFVKAE